MKRSLLRLALLLLVLVPVSLRSANADPCYSCICLQQCQTTERACVQACGSDSGCKVGCSSDYNDCQSDCLN
jgi:hypothetical protein